MVPQTPRLSRSRPVTRGLGRIPGHHAAAYAGTSRYGNADAIHVSQSPFDGRLQSIDTCIDMHVPWHGQLFESEDFTGWDGGMRSMDDVLRNCNYEPDEMLFEDLMNENMFDDTTEGLLHTMIA